MRMNKADYVTVTINYQRYLLPINKVQQVTDMVSLLQPITDAYDKDGNSFYVIEDSKHFSVELLDREVKTKGE